MAALAPYLRGRRRAIARLPLWLLGLAWLCAGPAQRASGQVAGESKVEAVLLYNLARFVDWPTGAFAQTNSPIVIGILGHDPFGLELEQAVAGETVNGRPIRVEHCSSVEEAARCHIVFVSSSERRHARQIVAQLKGHPVLTVSDLSDFARRAGGMVAFYINDQNKIRLRLNLEAAKSAHLSVSSKLIQVAELQKSSAFWPVGPLRPLQYAALLVGARPWRSRRALSPWSRWMPAPAAVRRS